MRLQQSNISGHVHPGAFPPRSPAAPLPAFRHRGPPPRPASMPAGDMPLTERVPVHVSEILLFLYISTMIVALSAPQYNAMSNAFGLFVGFVSIAEFFFIRRRGNPFVKLLPLLGMGLFVFMVATAVIYLPVGTERVGRHIQVFALFGLVFYTIRTTGRMSSVSLGFAAGILILFPIVMTQAGIMQELDPETRLQLDLAGGEGGLNPNGYGIMLNIAILLAVYEIYANRKVRKGPVRFILLAVGIAVVCAASYQIIFFLGSRQNQLWLFVSLLGLAAILTRGRLTPKRILIAGFATFTLLGIMMYLLIGSPHLDRIMGPINTLLRGEELGRSDYSRIQMIKVGWQMFLGSPVWGYGMEGYRIYSGLRGYSHNMYIETLVNFGVIGFCLFFSYHFIILKRNIVLFHLNVPGLRMISIWILICFTGIAISYMFRPTPLDKSMHIFLGALGGLVYYYYDRFCSRRYRR